MLKRKNGFSFMEILVVIIIIAVLVAFFALKYKGSTQGAREFAIRDDIHQIQTALDMGNIKENRYYIIPVDSVPETEVTDEKGKQVATEGLKLYNIDTNIMPKYLKKTRKPLQDYYSDANGSVYYKGVYK